MRRLEVSKTIAAAAALVIGTMLGTSLATAAEQRVTPKEAEAMVKKGVMSIKAGPRDKILAEMTDPKGPWVDRELYLTVYKMDGTALAHGANAKFVGKNMIDLRDGNGKEHIRERMEMAKTKSVFWQDFTFLNPVNKKIEPKQMYCEKADELIVCGGIYKPV
jgi:hypothetical protein